MQVVENTCIGHEISLRKISEPLALKALDFIPVTAQPQEMQCCRSTSESIDAGHKQQEVQEPLPFSHPIEEQDPDHLPTEQSGAST